MCLNWTTILTQNLWIVFAGFVSPLGYCCRHVGGADCWQTLRVNGTEVFASSCSDPSKYISWDGTHYTEAANKWVANHIVDGSLSDPPVSLTKACQRANLPNWSISQPSSCMILSSKMVSLLSFFLFWWESKDAFVFCFGGNQRMLCKQWECIWELEWYNFLQLFLLAAWANYKWDYLQTFIYIDTHTDTTVMQVVH